MTDSLAMLLKNKVKKHTGLASNIEGIITNLLDSLDFMVKEFKVSEIPGRPSENKIAYHVEVIHYRVLSRREYDISSILAYEFAEQFLLPNSGKVAHIERTVSFKLKEEDAS